MNAGLNPVEMHSLRPDSSFDGGNLDCGNGLLLLIRRHIDPLARGQLLEIRSSEGSVEEDLPAWCRLTGNELISWTRAGSERSYLVCKGKLAERAGTALGARVSLGPRVSNPRPDPSATPEPRVTNPRADWDTNPRTGPSAVLGARVSNPRSDHLARSAPFIPLLAVMGIGSWPRPRWMLQSVHEYVERRLSEADFQATADDAVRLAMQAQLRAGVDVVTDGEQRRDSYASFVGSRLENCQLIPLTDLLPLVDDPEKFERELRALDVPAADVRHPALLGRLERRKPLALHEFEFARTLTNKPVKIALPGPYLLTRTMWLDCLPEKVYSTREELAADITRILRDELTDLLEAGVGLVQFDEPVLTEVVFGGAARKRSFMCGALSEKKEPAEELAFARELMNAVTAGLPLERIAVHICRGNWTPDESAALSGSYDALLPYLTKVNVGNYFLELCTPRAGELEALRDLPRDRRIGVGVVNQKHAHVETVAEILVKAKRAIALFGRSRVFFTPDCGFATFADNPIASQEIAEQKLRAISEAVETLREL